MATETVPADIAAAIDAYVDTCRAADKAIWVKPEWISLMAKRQAARDHLDAAILTHLRKADELAATLDRIASGGV